MRIRGRLRRNGFDTILHNFCELKKKPDVKKLQIGVAIDTSVKPSRDFLLALERVVIDRDAPGRLLALKFFLGSAATTPANLAKFVSSGIDAMIFCGMPRKIVFRYLESAPVRPPVVLCTYIHVSKEEFKLMRPCAVVMRDNAAIGRTAADFFIKRGMRNFAFIGRKGNREDIAGFDREEAFRARIENGTGADFRFSRLTIGEFAANEDYWEVDQAKTEAWIKSLPLPCGVFVNGDHLAFGVANCCRRLGIDVPGSIEILSVNHNDGFSERAAPSISVITPSSDAIAAKTLDIALELAADPSAGGGSRVEMVDACDLDERASTSIGRGYGLVASKAKEFIRQNASRGIKVGDVAAALGISRRTLEFRVKESTGSDVRSMIADTRMEKICELLATTGMPIVRVLEASGSPIASCVYGRFKKRFGMTMREYRRKAAAAPAPGDATA